MKKGENRPAGVRGFRQRYLPWTMPEGGTIELPFLDIRLIGPTGRSLITNALIDSGATASFVPRNLAQLLKLRYMDSRTTYGAGGKFRAQTSSVIIQYLKNGVVKGTSADATVYVPFDDSNIPYSILGRNTVFRAYEILFLELGQEICLRCPRKSPAAKRP